MSIENETFYILHFSSLKYFFHIKKALYEIIIKGFFLNSPMGILGFISMPIFSLQGQKCHLILVIGR